MYSSYLWKYFTIICTEMFISRTLVSTPVAAPAGRVALKVDERILDVGKVVMAGQKVAITGKEGDTWNIHMHTHINMYEGVVCLPSSIFFVTVTCSHNGTTEAWDPIADNQREVTVVVMSATNSCNCIFTYYWNNHCHSLSNIEFVH